MPEEQQREQQIERLLGYTGVGPQVAAAIAKNLGTSEKELQRILDRLVQNGRLQRLEDGRYSQVATAATARRQGA